MFQVSICTQSVLEQLEFYEYNGVEFGMDYISGKEETYIFEINPNMQNKLEQIA